MEKPTCIYVSDPSPREKTADKQKGKCCCLCSCWAWVVFILVLIVLAGGVGYYWYTYIRFDSSKLKRLTNAEYLYDGYDVMFGNPRDTKSTLDPGIRDPIFVPSYTDEKASLDKKFLLPDKTSVKALNGSCTRSFHSERVDSVSSYSKSLELNANVKGNFWGAKFSASANYQTVRDETSNNESFFTITEAKCLAYTASLDEDDLPKFESSFLQRFIELPKEFQKEKYLDFIEKYGTHYIQQITMGSLYGKITQVNKKKWESREDKSLSVTVAASYETIGASVEGKLSAEQKSKMNEVFLKARDKHDEYTMGGLVAPTDDTQLENWVKQTSEAPGPIAYKLQQIDNLAKGVIKTGKITIEHGKIIKENLTKALKGYCDELLGKEDNLVQSCKAPVDKPEAKPREWSKWSNGTSNGSDQPKMQCAEGLFVTQISLAARGDIVNHLKIRCSDGSEYKNNEDLTGEYATLDCAGGFQRLKASRHKKHLTSDGVNILTVGLERHLERRGIYNAETFCVQEEIEQIAFEKNLDVEYYDWLECAPGQQIVGIQSKYDHEGHHIVLENAFNFKLHSIPGIDDIRIACA